jgi:hypothetical protein
MDFARERECVRESAAERGAARHSSGARIQGRALAAVRDANNARFDSLEAVKEFAGEDYEVAVVPSPARKRLSHFDGRSAHYETVLQID